MEHYVWSKGQLEDARDLLMWDRVNFLDEALIELREQQMSLNKEGRFAEAGEKFNEFMLLAIELGLVRDEQEIEMIPLPVYLVDQIDAIVIRCFEEADRS